RELFSRKNIMYFEPIPPGSPSIPSEPGLFPLVFCVSQTASHLYSHHPHSCDFILALTSERNDIIQHLSFED
ncbi:mCG146336, partial [Mus musculus]